MLAWPPAAPPSPHATSPRSPRRPTWAAAGALVAFDPDAAGRRAAVRAYHLLSTFTHQTEVAEFAAGQDPAQVFAGEGPAVLARILADCTRPLADVVIDNEIERWSRWTCYPEGQIHALRAAARLIAAMPPSHVGRQVSRLAAAWIWTMPS